MLRLDPEGYYRFVPADKFEVSYAGGEANVAVSLANYGMDAAFVTKLPDNPLGAAARNEVRRFGVDTSYIVWGGPRLGIYFAEKGASQRASKVIYDRARSSIALASRKDFDWAKILKGAKWFHFVASCGRRPRPASAWRSLCRMLTCSSPTRPTRLMSSE